MRSTKIALHLAALGLGTALIAGPAVAQDYYVGDQQAKTGQPGAAAPGASNYPTGRSANDGGFVTQPQNQAAPERQFAWEGNHAAYGGQYRTGQYYNYSPNWGFRRAGAADRAERCHRLPSPVPLVRSGQAAPISALTARVTLVRDANHRLINAKQVRRFLGGLVQSLFGLTAAAKFWKKSSATFFAAPLIRRWPSCASLPPICASTS